MKLSKQQRKLHNEALELLKKDVLSYDDRIFVLENYNESATNSIEFIGAFFTPLGLSRDFSTCISKGKVLDLCSGIGILSYYIQRMNEFNSSEVYDITCVEQCQEYYEIGKKILPNARWICGSIFDPKVIEQLDNDYDTVISNPPFGAVKTDKFGTFKTSKFEYKTIELASKLGRNGIFILPQNSTPFMYSGKSNFEEPGNDEFYKLVKHLNCEYEFNYGIDTSAYAKDWKNTNIITEIVHFEFNKDSDIEEEPNEILSQEDNYQLTLF